MLGGATFTFLVKGGTVAVLVRADLDAPAVELPPLRVATVRRAAAFDLDRFTEGAGASSGAISRSASCSSRSTA